MIGARKSFDVGNYSPKRLAALIQSYQRNGWITKIDDPITRPGNPPKVSRMMHAMYQPKRARRRHSRSAIPAEPT